MFVEPSCNGSHGWMPVRLPMTCQEEDAEADAEEQAEMAEVNAIN